MCGRYASFRLDQDLLDAFLIDPTHGIDPADVAAWHASWNVAPTATVRIVVDRAVQATETVTDPAPVRSLRLARWGLVPPWAADPSVGSRMINARAEGLADKPAYRKAFASRRCLVPADGYYEWQASAAAPEPGAGPGNGPARRSGGRRKQPYFFRAADQGVLAFAGLYEFWRDRSLPEDDPHRWLVTTTVITTAATGPLGQIHDRRPAALTAGLWDAWLSPRTSVAEAEDVLRAPGPELAWYPVSSRVSSVRNDGPELIEPDGPVHTGAAE